MEAGFTAGLLLGFAIGFIMYFSEKKRNKQLINKLHAETERRMQAEANYKAMKNKYEDFDQIIKGSIKSEVLDAFQKTNEQLLNVAKQHIEKNLQSHSNKLDSIVKPFEQVINEYKQSVEKFFKNSTEKLSGLTVALEHINRQSQDLSRQTQELINVLHSPTQRGGWGEMQLRRVFEIIGWTKGMIYQEQVTSKDSRPDFIITLPNKRKIIIDVKMTMSAYWNYMEADSKQQRKILAQEHVKALRSRIKELSQKAYWEQYDNSLDYVVLYMPIEAAFALAVSTDTTLFSDAMKQRIVLSSPSTIIPLVQMIDAMWRQNQAYQTVSTVVNEIVELRKRYSILLSYLNSLGKNIASTVEAYNNLIGSWRSRFDPQLRKLEQFKKGKDLPPLSKEIDTQPRQIK